MREVPGSYTGTCMCMSISNLRDCALKSETDVAWGEYYRKGMVQGRALLDHESSDEKDKQVVQPAVVPPQEQPQNVEQQQSRKKRKRSRTRAQRKQKKAAKLASDLQSMQIKMEVMDSDYEFEWEEVPQQ
eukprot:jgi/Botrbrau1/7827/Bobra.9_2s0008.1